MKIRDEHLYHGAVLNQIAEHPRFTAINTIEDRDICCLTYKELTNLLEERRTARGRKKTTINCSSQRVAFYIWKYFIDKIINCFIKILFKRVLILFKRVLALFFESNYHLF